MKTEIHIITEYCKAKEISNPTEKLRDLKSVSLKDSVQKLKIQQLNLQGPHYYASTL